MRVISLILRLVVDPPGVLHGQVSDPVAAWQASFADPDELIHLLCARAAAGRLQPAPSEDEPGTACAQDEANPQT